MKSIKESVNIIKPESFELIEKTLTSAEINVFMQAVRLVRKTTFRVNTLKSDKISVTKKLREEGISISNFCFIDNAFIVNNADDNKMMKTDVFKNGEIYLQSLSSQIPPIVLAPQADESVLDLAAAPGSKTSQLAALMGNTGLIDAVEPDFIRIQKLEFTLSNLGVTNVNIFNDRGEKFLKDIENKYDKVLIDAPCSGEGRFNINDRSSYFSYRVQDIPKFKRLQSKLLFSALKAVKSGGVVVYSTCTLNTLENEEVLNETCSLFDCEIVRIPGNLYELAELTKPKSELNGVKLRSDIKNSIKIVPSQRIEGFFIAKIVKK